MSFLDYADRALQKFLRAARANLLSRSPPSPPASYIVSMIYRPYRPEDFPQLYAIEQECFQPPFRFPRRYMRQLLANPNAATWIAEAAQQMDGFAIVEWTTSPAPATAYIQTIEVALARRKRGIAAELLRRIESSVISAGAQVLWLHVAEENTSAIRLYLAHGFLPQGRQENHYAPGLAALIFAKQPDPSPIR